MCEIADGVRVQSDLDGDVVNTTGSKGLAVESICSLFEIADRACGQSDLDGDFVITTYSESIRSLFEIADGACGQSDRDVDIVITTYSKGVAVESICSLFEIADDARGRSYLMTTVFTTRSRHWLRSPLAPCSELQMVLADSPILIALTPSMPRQLRRCAAW